MNNYQRSRGSRFDTLSEASGVIIIPHVGINVSDIGIMCRSSSCVSHFFSVCVCPFLSVLNARGPFGGDLRTGFGAAQRGAFGHLSKSRVAEGSW